MEMTFLPLATSAVGTSRTLTVYRFGAPAQGRNVYVQAAMHADEQPASLAAARLICRLAELEAAGQLAGQITVVPVANPIGLDQVTRGHHEGRHDVRTGGNFNRDFPDFAPALATRLSSAVPDNQLIETIRQAARQLIDECPAYGELASLRLTLMKLAIDADLVLDLHTGHGSGLLHLFISERDWPSLGGLAGDLGCDFVYWHAPFPRNSTFTASVGALWARLSELCPNLNVPQACQALVVELRGQADYNPSLATQDAENLIRHLKRRAIVSGDVGDAPPAPRSVGSVDCIEIGYSPAPGTLFFHKQVGEPVVDGDLICSVLDASQPLAIAFETFVRARTSGTLLTRAADGDVTWPNRMIFSVAGVERVPVLPGIADMRS